MSGTEQATAGLSARERWNLRLLLIAETTSTGGTQVTAVALPLLLIQSFAISPFVLSAFAAARYLPYVFLGVPIGRYVDTQRDPRRTMLAADATRLLTIVLVPVLWLVHALVVPVLFVIILAVASLRVLYDLSSSVFVVRSFDRSNWLTANSRVDSLFAVMESAGPPIAGAVASALGAVWAFLIDAASYAVSFVCVRILREPPQPPEPVIEPGRAEPSRAAAAFLFGHPTLRLIAAASSVQNAALMTLQSVALLILIQVRGLPPYLAGVVVAGMGVGGAIGAFLAPRMTHRFGLAPLATVAALSTIAAPLCLLLPGVPYRVVVYLGGYLLLGWGVTLTSVTTRRYRQEVIPPESFARVQGLYGSLLMGSLPLGALLGGALAQRITPLAAVVGASVLFAAAAALLLAARSQTGHRMEISG